MTDANLVLGYMDPERLIGDGMRLDERAARAALDPIAFAMGVDVETAALGIIRVANSAMVRALRRVTVERGIDGRRCTLLAFGGAGPMHAVEVARAFSIDTVIVPAHSGVFSALGCAEAEMSYSRQRTLRMAVGDWDRERLHHARRDLESRLVAPLAAAGHDDSEVTVEEVAAIRYSGQSYAVELSDPPFEDAARMGVRFFDRHLEPLRFRDRGTVRAGIHPDPGVRAPQPRPKCADPRTPGESRLGSGGCPARSLRGRKRRRHATTAPHSSPSAPSRDRSLSRTRGPRRWFRRGQP